MAGFEPAIDMEIQVPLDLLSEFERVPRIVIRHPWIVGIPVPEILLKADMLKRVEAAGFEVMLVPRQMRM